MIYFDEYLRAHQERVDRELHEWAKDIITLKPIYGPDGKTQIGEICVPIKPLCYADCGTWACTKREGHAGPHSHEGDR